MPSLTLAVWIIVKIIAIGAGIGAGIVLTAWLLRRLDRLAVVSTPQRELAADLERATGRIIHAQDRFRGPQAARAAEGADFPRGAA